ncbi:hypothetical protein ACN28S_59130 [Cystobacter fuscus]
MRSPFPFRRVTLLALLGAVLLSVPLSLHPLLRGLSLVARASGRDEGLAGQLARWDTQSFTVEDTPVPSRHGPLRARVFRPARPGAAPSCSSPGCTRRASTSPVWARSPRISPPGDSPCSPSSCRICCATSSPRASRT